MPRLKKASYETRNKASKMRRRRERELARQMRHDEMERQKLDGEFYQRKAKEIEDMKYHSNLYLSSFAPQWTESNEDSHSHSDERKNTSNDSVTKLPNEFGSTLHNSNEYPASSAVCPASSAVGVESQEKDFPVKVEQDVDFVNIKVELDNEDIVIGNNKVVAGDIHEQIHNRPADESQTENFVVDCDPTIVTNPGLSIEESRPLGSDDGDDDDNSCYSSSSNNQFFNEMFYKNLGNCPSIMNDAELAKALQEHYDKIDPINDESYEKRRKAAAIQRRRRKVMLERLTEEQLKEYRAAQTEACRLRRLRRLERMSEEEKQRDRMLKNALCLARRHRREAMMSEEERLARRATAAAAQREKRKRKRDNMTEEELKAHKAEVAAIWRMRRHMRYMKMSEEERQAERAKAAEAKRISRQRQKDKDDSTSESVETPKRPTRKKPRTRVELSEDESDILETSNCGVETTGESLITQILKQTQNIAALESEQVKLVPGHSLSQLSRDETFPEGSQETYLLPHEIPDKETDLTPPPKVSDETYLLPHEIPDKESTGTTNNKKHTYLLPHETVNHHTLSRETSLLPHEMPEKEDRGSNQRTNPETYHLPLSMPERPETNHQSDVIQDGKIKQEPYPQPPEIPKQLGMGHTSEISPVVPGIHHDENSAEYHRSRVRENNQSTTPLYHHDQMQTPQQPLHLRPDPMDHLRTAQHYPPESHYDHRMAALHHYHLNNSQIMDRTGSLQQYHHIENQDNQTAALQQYHLGRNYMNTLY